MDAARGQDKALRLARNGVEACDKGVTAAEARNAKGGPAPWDRQVDGYRPGGVGEQLEDAVMEDNEGAVLEGEGGMDEAAVMQWGCPNPGCGYVHNRRDVVQQHFAMHGTMQLHAVQVPVPRMRSDAGVGRRSSDDEDHRGLRTLIALWSLNHGGETKDMASTFSAQSWMQAAGGGLKLQPLPTQPGPARDEAWAEQIARLLGDCGMSEFVVKGRLTQLRQGGSLDEYDTYIRNLLPAIEKQVRGDLAILREWGQAAPPRWPPSAPATVKSFVKVYLEGFRSSDSVDAVQTALHELFPAMQHRKWPTDIRMPSKRAKESVEGWRIRQAPSPVVCLTAEEAMEWMTGARKNLQRDGAGNLRLQVFVGGEARWLVMGWVQSESDLRLKARVMVAGKPMIWEHNQGLSLWNHMLWLAGAMKPAREELAGALLAAQGLPNNGVVIGGHVKAGVGGRAALRPDMADEMLVAVSEEVAESFAGKTFTLIAGDYVGDHILFSIRLDKNESPAVLPRARSSDLPAAQAPSEDYYAIEITLPPGPVHKSVGDGSHRDATAADLLQQMELWLQLTETSQRTSTGDYATLEQTLIDTTRPTFGTIAQLSPLGMMRSNHLYVVCKSKEAAAAGLHVLRESQKPLALQSKHTLSVHPWDPFTDSMVAAEVAATVRYRAGVVTVLEVTGYALPDITDFKPWTGRQEHIPTRSELIEHGVLKGRDPASVHVEEWVSVGESVPANFDMVGQEVQCVCCSQKALGQTMQGTTAGPSLCYKCVGLVSAGGQAGIPRLMQSPLVLAAGTCPMCNKDDLVMQTGKADERMHPTPPLCGPCHLRNARNNSESQLSFHPDPVHKELVAAVIAKLQQAFAAFADAQLEPPEGEMRDADAEDEDLPGVMENGNLPGVGENKEWKAEQHQQQLRQALSEEATAVAERKGRGRGAEQLQRQQQQQPGVTIERGVQQVLGGVEGEQDTGGLHSGTETVAQDARSGAENESETGFGLEKQNGQGGVEGERVQQGEMDGGKGTGESLGGGMAVQDEGGGVEYEKGPGESQIDGAEEEIELETEEEDSSFLTEVGELETSAIQAKDGVVSNATPVETNTSTRSGKERAGRAKDAQRRAASEEMEKAGGDAAEDQGGVNEDKNARESQEGGEGGVQEELVAGECLEGGELGVQEERGDGEMDEQSGVGMDEEDRGDVEGGEPGEQGGRDDVEMDDIETGADGSSTKRTATQAIDGAVSPAKTADSPSKGSRSKKPRGGGTQQRLDFQSPPGGRPGPPGGARRQGMK
jgi:hypothetical protein